VNPSHLGPRPSKCARMAMMSFRADDEAMATQRWAEALCIDKSELLRDALHRHLTRLASEQDVERRLVAPPRVGSGNEHSC
jgi:hypothetical protein